MWTTRITSGHPDTGWWSKETCLFFIRNTYWFLSFVTRTTDWLRLNTRACLWYVGTAGVRLCAERRKWEGRRVPKPVSATVVGSSASCVVPRKPRNKLSGGYCSHPTDKDAFWVLRRFQYSPPQALLTEERQSPFPSVWRWSGRSLSADALYQQGEMRNDHREAGCKPRALAPVSCRWHLFAITLGVGRACCIH